MNGVMKMSNTELKELMELRAFDLALCKVLAKRELRKRGHESESIRDVPLKQLLGMLRMELPTIYR